MTQAKGSSTTMDLDDFLGHETRGARANYLGNWKSREPPEILIVLHTKAPIHAVWSHPWPKIVTREKDGREVREVWSGSFNSWESEDTLKNQYRRDDSGKREHPPLICPMSLMLEDIWQKWKSGELSWDQVLFEFVGDDSAKAKRLHVGGMLNQIGKIWEDLTEREKKDAIAKKVPSPKEAWKESMVAKCQYVFTVVDYDNPGDGIQVTTETTLVGDKMKKAIRDRIKSEGPDKGHPSKTPYVFQWTHVPNAKEFSGKYDVVALGGTKPVNSVIRQLVVEQDPPDTSRIVQRGDIADLRASMEDHYVGPEGALDFDLYFAAAEKLIGMERPEDDGKSAGDVADEITGEQSGEHEIEDEDPKPDPKPKQEPKPAPKTQPKQEPKVEPKTEPKDPPPAAATRKRRTAVAEPKEDPRYVVADTVEENGETRSYAADGMELMPCDNCQTIMRADEDTCRECGTKYEIEQEAPAPAAKPAATSAAKPAAGKPSASKETAKAGGKDRLGF